MADKKTPDLKNVAIDDGFWSPRLRAIDTATINTIYRQLVDSGRFENLRRAAEGLPGD